MSGATWPVELAEPDLAWRQVALEGIREVWQVLEPWRAGGVHHVGSTAIPEVPAEPVVDLLGGLADARAAGPAGAALQAAGWEPDALPVHAADDPERGPRYTRQRDDGVAVTVELLTPGSPRWETAILFRDRLRADDVLRRQYARTKRRASLRASDRQDYENRKAAFVSRVVRAG